MLAICLFIQIVLLSPWSYNRQGHVNNNGKRTEIRKSLVYISILPNTFITCLKLEIWFQALSHLIFNIINHLISVNISLMEWRNWISPSSKILCVRNQPSTCQEVMQKILLSSKSCYVAGNKLNFPVQYNFLCRKGGEFSLFFRILMRFVHNC